ncbi:MULTISPECIES: DUF2971 domain-containing protein [Arthrobacter]|nr:DUF2971 domain-containing protein [Arthrobacter citreus]
MSKDLMSGAGNLVWHYCDGAALKNALNSRVLWASSAAYMNDSKELMSGNEVLADRLREVQTEFPELQAQALLDTVGTYSSSRESKFILSASNDPDSLTLWRYYGREQVSFAIGLDRDVDLHVQPQNLRDAHPFPPSGYYDGPRNPDGTLELDPDRESENADPWVDVIYDPSDQEAFIKEKLDRIIDELQTPNGGQQKFRFRRFFAHMALQSALSTIKDSGFRDEKEARIIAEVTPSWKYVLHRPGRFGMIPYVELAASTPPPRSKAETDEGDGLPARLPIRQINIGPTPYPEEAKFGLEQLLSFLGYHDVKVAVSEIPYR